MKSTTYVHYIFSKEKVFTGGKNCHKKSHSDRRLWIRGGCLFG